MRKHLRLSIGYWIGFLILILNQTLEITTVTINGRLESASAALSTPHAFLPLIGYALIGAGARLLAARRRRRTLPADSTQRAPLGSVH